MNEKTVFQQSFVAGSRVYEFEVRTASTRAKYLVITEIHHLGAEPTARGTIMVFEDHLGEFRRAARAAMQFMRSCGPRAPNSPGQARAYDVASIRRKYPRAYERWSPEEDAMLQALNTRGYAIKQLVVEFQRQPGAIRSRLKRLGFSVPS